MTDKRIAKVADEDDAYEINIRVGSIVERVVEADNDDFAKSYTDISGIAPTLKRKGTRELKKFHQGMDGARSKKNETIESVTGYTLFEVVLPPYNLDYLASLYEKAPVHGAAVRAKANNIVGLGWDFVESEATKQVLDQAGDNQDKVARIRRKLARGKQELLKWIDDCNEEDEFDETLKKVWIDYETTGNGYFEIGRVKTGPRKGQIGYIGHIPSTTMRVRKKRDGFVQIISNRAVFFRNFGDRKTTDPIGGDGTPNEVIHIKKYTPTNGYYGVPDIISAMVAVAGNEFSGQYNLDYFQNKAVPRYVIIVKGGTLSDSAQQQLLEFFQSGLKGKNHRTLYVPLPADEADRKVSFEMKPVEAGVQDSSFNNYRKANLLEILMAHGVPISKVSVGDGMSLAAARDADKNFKEQVCQPEQRVLQKKLNKLVKEVTDVFILKLNELSLTDEDTQSKIDERYLRLGTFVPNEVRARKGMPGIKGGDKQIDLSPQAKAEQATQATGNRQRDQQRTSNSTDSTSSTNTRNAKGDGRQQA